MFKNVSSWVLEMSVWDLVGAISYTLSFSLFETLVVFLPLVLLGHLIPKRWLGDKFVALSGAFVLEASFMAIAIHYDQKILLAKLNLLIIFLGVFSILTLLVYKFSKLKMAFGIIAERITFLALLYLFLDGLGLLIVLSRNL